MIIGLTGTYCAGKNYISSLLEARGLPVLDVDKFGYKALELEKETIYTQFGADFKKINSSWNPKADLDRRLLGLVVFGNPEKLAILEAIIHPVADSLTKEWLETQNRPCVINAALLHRSFVFERLDRIILVNAPLLTRFIRAKKRDKLTFPELIKRFSSQKDFYSQYLTKKAEIYRIENPGLHCRPDLAGSRNLKLESRIDKFLEGIK
ncbi:MAG: dephospho-CoA kinase [Treponema sp.]|nr:dephospho-CoA kinase [Treponema sp.]